MLPAKCRKENKKRHVTETGKMQWGTSVRLLISLSILAPSIVLPSRVWRSHGQGNAYKPALTETVLARPVKQISRLICYSKFTYSSQGPFPFLPFPSALSHVMPTRMSKYLDRSMPGPCLSAIGLNNSHWVTQFYRDAQYAEHTMMFTEC